MRKLFIVALFISIISGCENAPVNKNEISVIPPVQTVSTETPLDKEIARLMEKGNSMAERKEQVKAIETLFLSKTSKERSRYLAALCFTKTIGTKLMPIDLAEIAVAETGGNSLSSKAVSPKGALGVWQIMPQRAKSHGYLEADMKNDELCAEAAVKELLLKIKMANGDIEKGKKLYCGRGREADAYLKKIQSVRKEVFGIIDSQSQKVAMNVDRSRYR